MTHRTYLAVPFSERNAAKRAGARFDGDRRAWYTEQITDALRRWLPSEPAPLNLQVDPRADFGAVMQGVGCLLGGQHPIMDGRPHRVATDGDKRAKRSGFYVLHEGPVLWGYVLNHRTGEHASWPAARDRELSEQERANLRALAADQQAKADALNEVRQYAVALRTARQLDALRPLGDGKETVYLQAKGIASRSGLYSSADGRRTYVPMQDIRDQLWSLQSIGPDGDKHYQKGGRVQGCFHVLGGCQRLRDAERSTFVVAEGYATAATVLDILEADGAQVTAVAAFHASNLVPVAEDLRRRFARSTIVIAGDDDRANRVNTGRLYAQRAADAVQGIALFPPFTAEHPQTLSDWNDIDRCRLPGYDRETHCAALREQVRAFERGLRRPASRSVVDRQPSDLNDEQELSR